MMCLKSSTVKPASVNSNSFLDMSSCNHVHFWLSCEVQHARCQARRRIVVTLKKTPDVKQSCKGSSRNRQIVTICLCIYCDEPTHRGCCESTRISAQIMP